MNQVTELTMDEVELVNGGISEESQITLQSAIVAVGVGLAAGGLALTPFGAAVFIGTSVAGTVSYIVDNISLE